MTHTGIQTAHTPGALYSQIFDTLRRLDTEAIAEYERQRSMRDERRRKEFFQRPYEERAGKFPPVVRPPFTPERRARVLEQAKKLPDPESLDDTALRDTLLSFLSGGDNDESLSMFELDSGMSIHNAVRSLKQANKL